MDHPGEIRECLFIYGEGPVFVLEVDIEPKNVGGNAISAHSGSHFPKLRRREISVARLLETESPEWWHRSRPSEPRPRGNDCLWFRTVEEVVVERTVHCAEGVAVRVST